MPMQERIQMSKLTSNCFSKSCIYCPRIDKWEGLSWLICSSKKVFLKNIEKCVIALFLQSWLSGLRIGLGKPRRVGGEHG